MAVVGYTPGGSPIFWGNSGPKKKTKGQKNTRFRCTSCNHRTTKNQAKITSGKCLYCKNWLRAFKPNES